MPTKFAKIIKWTFDRVSAALGLIVLSPLLAGIALAIKIKMPGGPVFFRQKRIGQYGKPFTFVKFRTMGMHNETNTITQSTDARITPLGAVLRRNKLDELPGLWNVMIGNMSLVGPRPDVKGYADKLTGDAKKILTLKPGITGPATLKYRNEEEILSMQDDPKRYNDEVIWPDKVRINLEYLNDWTLIGDLKIIMFTIFKTGKLHIKE